MGLTQPAWLTTRTASLLGFAAFATVLLARIAGHSPWRDEAQAWLLAAQAGSVLELLALPGEGHPPLWYLALRPFTWITTDLWGLKLPTALLAVGTLALLWFRSALPLLEKLLFSASYPLSFQYAVLGRSYVLGAFLLALYATSFDWWRRHPALGGVVLGLVALTHVYLAIVAAAVCALTLLLWRRAGEPVRTAAWLLLPFMVLCLCSAASVIAPDLPAGTAANLAAPRLRQGALVRAGQLVGSGFVRNTLPPVPFELVQGLAALALLGAALRQWLPGLVFLAAAAAIVVLHVVVFRLGNLPQHAGSFFVLLMAWVLIDRSLLYRPLVVALLAASVVAGASSLYRGLSAEYSAGEAAAELIRARGLDRATWVGFPATQATVPFAILKRPAYSLECECEFTSVDFTRNVRNLGSAAVQERLGRFVDARPNEDVYVLAGTSNLSQLVPDRSGRLCLEEIGRAERSVLPDERFALLRVASRTESCPAAPPSPD